MIFMCHPWRDLDQKHAAVRTKDESAVVAVASTKEVTFSPKLVCLSVA